MSCLRHIRGLFGGVQHAAPSTPNIKTTFALIQNLHAHQFDTATNTPYETHPMRVMDIYKVVNPGNSKDELMACQLHDAAEDGRVSYIPQPNLPTLSLCPLEDYLDDKGGKKYSERTISMLTAGRDPNNPDAVRRDEVVNLLAALGYSETTMCMIGAVSKPPKLAKENRSLEQKLADNAAFVEKLVETGTLPEKLLKFSDALANRERQAHEIMGRQYDVALMAYRMQKTSDTLSILYKDPDVQSHLEQRGFKTLEETVEAISDAHIHYTDWPEYTWLQS